MYVHAVDQADVPPIEMPARFKHDVAYFMTPPGQGGAPDKLPSGEYWIDRQDAERWLADGVLEVISPLDSQRHAELEISAEQEAWLEWLILHQVRHIRIIA
jgi:hypothetical protein